MQNVIIFRAFKKESKNESKSWSESAKNCSKKRRNVSKNVLKNVLKNASKNVSKSASKIDQKSHLNLTPFSWGKMLHSRTGLYCAVETSLNCQPFGAPHQEGFWVTPKARHFGEKPAGKMNQRQRHFAFKAFGKWAWFALLKKMTECAKASKPHPPRESQKTKRM